MYLWVATNTIPVSVRIVARFAANTYKLWDGIKLVATRQYIWGKKQDMLSDLEWISFLCEREPFTQLVYCTSEK